MRTETADPQAFVRGLPKAELHVHLQGAASVETVLELSRRHPEVGVPTDAAALGEFYRFRDFAHFVEVYLTVNKLVRTPDDVQALVVGLGRDLAAVQVRYAEVTVTPDSHLYVGIPPDGLADALDRGRREVAALFGVELAWVYDIAGELGVRSGVRAITWAEQYRPECSVGFGLGGAEAQVPRLDFVEVFQRAGDLGFHLVPHAGETMGPQTVRDALTLGAERIGHGIAAAQDPALMAELVDRGVTLEVCPTSNIRTRAVATLAEHPFPVLRDSGVTVTLNTDDPGMFDTDLNREYLIAHEVFGLTLGDLADLSAAAVEASFAPAATKTRILDEITAYRCG